MLRSALEIVSKLHTRWKDNERAHLDLRHVSEEDADLSVHIVAFVIRELGWAR